MPVVNQSPYTCCSLSGGITSTTTTPFNGLEIDHLLLFITFTLDTLTSVDIDLQESLDGSTWYDVYAADKTQITVQFTASFTGAIYCGQGSTANTKMQPVCIAAPLWRFNITPTGTTGSSALDISAMGFVLGALRD